MRFRRRGEHQSRGLLMAIKNPSVRRLASTSGRGDLSIRELPRIEGVAPKLAKAFPDDIRKLQEVLDEWKAHAESQIKIAINNATGG